MQKERDLKRKQMQAKKEAEAQARLLVLKVKLFLLGNYLLINRFALVFLGRT